MYRFLESGFIENTETGIRFPEQPGNRFYDEYIKLVESGSDPAAPYLEPPKTKEQRISEIESEATQRNIRAAILGDTQAKAMLQNIEDRIAQIRGQS